MGSFLSPFLKTGVTLAAFQHDGTVPFSRLRLMMRTMGVTIEEMVSWRLFALMSLGPDDLLGSSDCTMPHGITVFTLDFSESSQKRLL